MILRLKATRTATTAMTTYDPGYVAIATELLASKRKSKKNKKKSRLICGGWKNNQKAHDTTNTITATSNNTSACNTTEISVPGSRRDRTTVDIVPNSPRGFTLDHVHNKKFASDPPQRRRISRRRGQTVHDNKNFAGYHLQSLTTPGISTPPTPSLFHHRPLPRRFLRFRPTVLPENQPRGLPQSRQIIRQTVLPENQPRSLPQSRQTIQPAVLPEGPPIILPWSQPEGPLSGLP